MVLLFVAQAYPPTPLRYALPGRNGCSPQGHAGMIDYCGPINRAKQASGTALSASRLDFVKESKSCSCMDDGKG